MCYNININKYSHFFQTCYLAPIKRGIMGERKDAILFKPVFSLKLFFSSVFLQIQLTG